MERLLKRDNCGAKMPRKRSVGLNFYRVMFNFSLTLGSVPSLSTLVFEHYSFCKTGEVVKGKKTSDATFDAMMTSSQNKRTVTLSFCCSFLLLM